MSYGGGTTYLREFKVEEIISTPFDVLEFTYVVHFESKCRIS